MHPKALRIMHQAYKEPQNDLLSPPLTPTEPTMQYWHQDRKAFIQSYGRMAPFLKRGNRHRVFSLHVYRDYLLAKGEQGFSTEARSDKAAVSPSKNRKSLDPKKRRVSALPSGKDAAAAFDALDIESQDLDFYPPQWAPRQDRLDSIPIKVSWKGAPMAIHQHPMYSRLHPVEASMASVLRLSPIQYLRCKRTLILAARTLKYQTIPFTKSVAQKLCRVDVNKTSALWTAYGQLGWFEESI